MLDRLKILLEFSKLIKDLKEGSSEAMIQLTGQGAIAQLETKFKKYYGYKYALTFSSATNAMTAVVDCLRIHNSEVITTPFNYYSSIGGLMLFGNKAIFVDTYADLTINPEQAEKAITSKSKAILAIDFAGNPHDTHEIRKLCDKYQLLYIADAAQSFGARCCDIPASSLADVLIVSMTTGKTLAAGEGACILMNDFGLYKKLLQFTHPLRTKIELGLSKHSEMIYMNGRINPFGAILANQHFDWALRNLAKYQKKCLHSRDVLKTLDSIMIPVIKGTSSYFYQFAYTLGGLNEYNIGESLTHYDPTFTIDFIIPFELIYNMPTIKNKFQSQIRIEKCHNAEKCYQQMFMIKTMP